MRYAALCEALGLEQAPVDLGHGAVTARWVANIYEADFALRAENVAVELLAEDPAEILSLDWTKDAAARCSGTWMFNAMDSDGKVLLSLLTKTAKPFEVEPAMRELRMRGAEPKVVYVDCDCCGAWKSLVAEVWPTAYVRLDGFHAIRRITQATASAKHPWHKRFCCMLSGAVYAYDAGEEKRFMQACKRDGVDNFMAKRRKPKYVPRFVNEKHDIERQVEQAFKEFRGKSHPQAGPLLIAKTCSSWGKLKEHVHAGCLCDPPDINLNVRTMSIAPEVSAPIAKVLWESWIKRPKSRTPVAPLERTSLTTGKHSCARSGLATYGRDPWVQL